MKRFCAVAVLMLLGSPAHAGESFSFVIGGHRIHIERPRHCNSASCVSVSIPGGYEKRGRRDRYDALAHRLRTGVAANAQAYRARILRDRERVDSLFGRGRRCIDAHLD